MPGYNPNNALSYLLGIRMKERTKLHKRDSCVHNRLKLNSALPSISFMYKNFIFPAVLSTGECRLRGGSGKKSLSVFVQLLPSETSCKIAGHKCKCNAWTWPRFPYEHLLTNLRLIGDTWRIISVGIWAQNLRADAINYACQIEIWRKKKTIRLHLTKKCIDVKFFEVVILTIV